MTKIITVAFSNGTKSVWKSVKPVDTVAAIRTIQPVEMESVTQRRIVIHAHRIAAAVVQFVAMVVVSPVKPAKIVNKIVANVDPQTAAHRLKVLVVTDAAASSVYVTRMRIVATQNGIMYV